MIKCAADVFKQEDITQQGGTVVDTKMEGNFEENADKNKKKKWDEDSIYLKKKQQERCIRQGECC